MEIKITIIPDQGQAISRDFTNTGDALEYLYGGLPEEDRHPILEVETTLPGAEEVAPEQPRAIHRPFLSGLFRRP